MAIKRQASATAGELGFDMTPMIDIVFQLIIFFITCVTFIETQTSQDLILPLADQAQPPADNSEKELFVFNVVNLKKLDVKGERVFKDKKYPFVVGGVHMNRDALREQLSFAWQASLARAGGDAKKVEAAVIIRGDRDVEWGHVLTAMAQAQQVGFIKVYLKALQVETSTKKTP